MQTQFKAMRSSREVYLRYFDNYTLEQLNAIPPGFNNNLIWNIGHIIISQQTLLYRGSGNNPHVSEAMIAKYFRGTKPEAPVTQAEADELKGLLLSLVQIAEDDYREGIFTTYAERRTELGFLLSNIEDAITFNNYHEGIHLGYMMAMSRLLK